MVGDEAEITAAGAGDMPAQELDRGHGNLQEFGAGPPNESERYMGHAIMIVRDRMNI